MKKSHASKLAAPIHRVGLTRRFALSAQSAAQIELLVPSGHPAPGERATSRVARTAAGRAGTCVALLLFQRVRAELALHQHFGPARLSSARCGDHLSPCAELSIVWRSAANPLRLHLLLAVTLARARQRIELASVESWRVQELRAVAVNMISRAIGKERELANVLQQFENVAHGFFRF